MSDTASTPFQLRWYLSVAVALLIFAGIGVYSMRMAAHTTDYDQEQATQRVEKLKALQAQDAKTLGTADWIDKDKGIVRIPIDEAMAQVLPMLAAKPVAMGAAIPGAMPPPANVPAPPAMGAPATPAASGRASDNNTKLPR